MKVELFLPVTLKWTSLRSDQTLSFKSYLNSVKKVLTCFFLIPQMQKTKAIHLAKRMSLIPLTKSLMRQKVELLSLPSLAIFLVFNRFVNLLSLMVEKYLSLEEAWKKLLRYLVDLVISTSQIVLSFQSPT